MAGASIKACFNIIANNGWIVRRNEGMWKFKTRK